MPMQETALGTIATLRLAVVNSVAFGATTIMPLWVATLPGERAASPALIALTATLQLGACAVANVATGAVFSAIAPVALARWALVIAALAGFAQSFGPLSLFVAAAIVAGLAFGVILNATNRVLAGSAQAQHGYALFQIVEVCFAASLYFGGALVIDRFGAHALFLELSACALVALLVLGRFDHGTPPERTGSAPPSLRAALMLASIALFFTGQSSINSFLIPLGERAGLSATAAASIVGSCMISALLGAILARVIGMRFGVTTPVLAIAAVLAVDFTVLGGNTSAALFVAGTVLIMSGTIMMVPYFFTALALLDRSGRYAAIAPAFLLGGVALGPSVALQLSSRLGFPALGLVAAALVLAAATLFVTARAFRRPGAVAPSALRHAEPERTTP